MRPLGAVAVDSTAWALAIIAAGLLHLLPVTDHVDIVAAAIALAITITVQLGVGFAAGLYRCGSPVGSHDDAGRCCLAAVTAGCVLFLGYLLTVTGDFHAGMPATATVLALTFMIVARQVQRRGLERANRPRGTAVKRAVVVGAGAAGQQLVRSMLVDPQGEYLPVAVLDDDPRKRRLRIAGVPVRGTRADIAATAAATGGEILIIAVAAIDAADLRDLSRAAIAAGLQVKLVPPVREIIRCRVRAEDLRDLDVADLIGRRQIDTNIATIAGYLTGKRVLVTGAGGSIGSELCRQIRRFDPSELMMLDRDESALHAVQLSIEGRALLDSPDVVLADLRDRSRIMEIFHARRPEVVFHAGALKHLPMLELYPEEGWKTNVIGTQNVLDAASATGVARLVNISTDKAANPISNLGRSKRIGERLVAHAAADAHGTFLSVRFGNVIGSRGSVLTTFTEQIACGGPITITDPGVTRFFMTTAEAVQLVIQAAAIGMRGEALVLDMGEPVRIVDIATHLMEIVGASVPIVYTGLRAGEKLHEELIGAGEVDTRPFHPAISHVTVPPLDPRHLQVSGPERIDQALIELATGGEQAVRAELPAEQAPVGVVLDLSS